MEKDIELEGFLTVLVQFHGISTTSIAKISGVSLQDVENCMEHKFDQVSDDAKYKIAITAMRLRFLLKECETQNENV
jgi:hypothetical protein